MDFEIKIQVINIEADEVEQLAKLGLMTAIDKFLNDHYCGDDAV